MSFHVRVQSSSKQVQDSSWTRSSVEDSGLTIMSVCCCYTDPPQDGISQMVFIQNCKATFLDIKSDALQDMRDCHIPRNVKVFPAFVTP